MHSIIILNVKYNTPKYWDYLIFSVFFMLILGSVDKGYDDFLEKDTHA